MSGQLEIQVTLSDPAKGFKDVLIEADAESSMNEVLAALRQVHPGPYFLGTAELPPRGRLGDSGLFNGAVITVGRPLAAHIDLPWELCVVGGPAAGTRFPLRGRPVV